MISKANFDTIVEVLQSSTSPFQRSNGFGSLSKWISMLILIQWSYLIFLQKHSKDIESLRVCQNEFQCIEIQFRYKVQHFKTSRYIEIQFQYKVQNFDTLRYIKIHCDTSRNQFDTTLEACQRYRRFRYFSKFISTPV